MRDIAVDSINALQSALEPFSSGCLFRGQAKHYTTPEGLPRLTSSFARQGCIPAFTRKWTGLAMHFLRRGMTGEVHPDAAQALLQHYGWRSFYVDLSGSSAVSSWFASHIYQPMNQTTTLDVNGEPLYLRRDRATYEDNHAHGHLYVLSPERLRAANITLLDLKGLDLGVRCRTVVQRAWLAGPLNRFNQVLDPQMILAHVSGPASVFREFAAAHSLTTVASVFPHSQEDMFLRFLEGQPWTNGPIHEALFRRSLEFPDYHADFETLLPPDVALFSGAWIAEGRRSEIADAAFFLAPELLFILADEAKGHDLSPVLAQLDAHGTLVLEADGMVRMPTPRPHDYSKGVVFESIDDHHVHISELFAEHPGPRLTGFGTNVGYTYRRSGGKLERAPRPADCRCQDYAWHQHHLATIELLSESLKRGAVRARDNKTYDILPW